MGQECEIDGARVVSGEVDNLNTAESVFQCGDERTSYGVQRVQVQVPSYKQITR
jgi:hypothetical protein